MSDVSSTLPDGTYIDLVRSLYTTLLPTTIMAISFLAVGGMVIGETGDPLLLSLLVLGVIASVARVATLLLGRRPASDAALTIAAAWILERRFAWAYLTFAIIFGLFSARAFQVASPETHILIVGLLFGYGAGVAAGVSLRPRIAITAALVAIVPTIVIAWASGNLIYGAAGTLLALFLGGGIESMLSRYRTASGSITMRRTYARLARQDDLTGLPNRLSLREGYEQFVRKAKRDDVLAIHCLDLDRFKPVNDRYGHPVGDALLRAVSDRLNGLLRTGDIAARLGGDEFVVLQTGARHPGEADLLARRVARSIAQPFSILGHQIIIGASVGYALFPEHGRDLDDLVARADEALVRVKREGGGVAAYREPEPEFERRLSA